MAYNNNFGSNAPARLTRGQEAAALAAFSAHVREETDTGYDDLFDDGAFRAAQTTFAGHAHRLKPQGLTHFRPMVSLPAQGLPAHAATAHGGARASPAGGGAQQPAAHHRAAWAAARASAPAFGPHRHPYHG